ncbi:hypothetical protein DM01DRAFT_1332997 [Hesseltinella vesiculosa]|uniref:RRM domain-containing protein n=1 Tax=Hesseltinella vesiculosa TaxID=101127 RepID=A0A1X2GRB4_9FUNG|nr:hypothetical protein DM01DRAFT_1332997 [Hesseltinella vesiculosa]
MTNSTLFSTSLDMRIHPLSATPNSNAFFSSTNSIPLTDDVTTIFVVGFPDDMTEREFQNMFTFCPGFEAASLKWHSKDQDEETAISSTGGKKQMIGFARFRSRLEAMEAVDVLSGKKVDQEKGTILKAEMAKKNLHIKRGSVAPIGNTFPTASSTPTTQQHTASTSGTLTPTSTSTVANGSTTSALNASSPVATNPPTTVGEGTLSLLSKKLGRQTHANYDAFSPLPSDLLSPADYHKVDPFMNDPFTCSTPNTPIFSDSLFSNLRSNSFDARPPNDLGIMSPPRHFGTGVVPPTVTPLSSSFTSAFSPQAPTAPSQLNGINPLHPPHPLAHSTHTHSQQPHPLHPIAHHPLHSQTIAAAAAEDDPYSYLSKSSPVSNDRLFGTSPLLDDLLSNRMNSITMQANNLTDLRSPSVASIHRPSNPADQNPPCNTLYVGNLPPSTNEEELRQLFAACQGYKRMCFRNKPQGPMCFVEFEDVTLATQALAEHQGFSLTTSIKGGIRLSYSKNPLFIKGPASKDAS